MKEDLALIMGWLLFFLAQIYGEDVLSIYIEHTRQLMNDQCNTHDSRYNSVESVIEHDRFAWEIPEDNVAGSIQSKESSNSNQIQDRNSIGMEHSEEACIQSHCVESLEVELRIYQSFIHLELGFGSFCFKCSVLGLAPVDHYLDERWSQ